MIRAKSGSAWKLKYETCTTYNQENGTDPLENFGGGGISGNIFQKLVKVETRQGEGEVVSGSSMENKSESI